MQRLITFGCSVTYGQGLSDCIRENNMPGFRPSEQAWPSILSRLLNVPVINKAIPGAGNLQILNEMLNFEFNEGDVVILMWSYIDREFLFLEDGTRQIASWTDNELARKWLEVHDNHDLIMRSWLNIHHGNLLLSSKNIKYYNHFAEYGEIRNHKPNWFDNAIYDINVPKLRKIDYANDNRHPGPLAHIEIAKAIERLL